MKDLEEMLHRLDTRPPGDLEARTLVAAGAADRVTRADSPVGAVWIAWSPRGVTALTPVFAAATIDDFLAHHRRRSYPADRMPGDLSTTVTEGLESGDTSGVPIDLTGIGTFLDIRGAVDALSR